jgi:hypothetical protein
MGRNRSQAAKEKWQKRCADGKQWHLLGAKAKARPKDSPPWRREQQREEAAQHEQAAESGGPSVVDLADVAADDVDRVLDDRPHLYRAHDGDKPRMLWRLRALSSAGMAASTQADSHVRSTKTQMRRRSRQAKNAHEQIERTHDKVRQGEPVCLEESCAESYKPASSQGEAAGAYTVVSRASLHRRLGETARQLGNKMRRQHREQRKQEVLVLAPANAGRTAIKRKAPGDLGRSRVATHSKTYHTLISAAAAYAEGKSAQVAAVQERPMGGCPASSAPVGNLAVARAPEARETQAQVRANVQETGEQTNVAEILRKVRLHLSQAKVLLGTARRLQQAGGGRHH